MSELEELRAAVAAAEPGQSVPVPLELAAALIERLEPLKADPDYGSRTGYDESFLGLEVALPAVAQDDVLAVEGTEDNVLRYEHFSLCMSSSRKFALWTAVNIDGTKRFTWTRESDTWLYDPRIPKEAQAGAALYVHNPFDRGHLVRRLDPVWGEQTEAVRANDDTFHWTNCALQFEKFNRNDMTWQGLEDHILNSAGGGRLSVFTGPVLREDDPEHRGVKVPLAYWKIVVAAPGEELSATAFLLSQKEIGPVPPRLAASAEFEPGEFVTFQVAVSRIEEDTGLDFGELRSSDPLVRRPRGAGEGPPQLKLGSLADVVLA